MRACASTAITSRRCRRCRSRSRGSNADALQKDIAATRGIMQKYPMMAALKAVIAHFGRDPDWATVRPPLVELAPAQSKSLIAELEARSFEMPGLAAPAVATA